MKIQHFIPWIARKQLNLNDKISYNFYKYQIKNQIYKSLKIAQNLLNKKIIKYKIKK